MTMHEPLLLLEELPVFTMTPRFHERGIHASDLDGFFTVSTAS